MVNVSLLSQGERIVLPDGSDETTLSPQDRIAILGQPRLGDLNTVVCNIRESVEFKVCMETVCLKHNLNYNLFFLKLRAG